jgi:hypothetical protein
VDDLFDFVKDRVGEEKQMVKLELAVNKAEIKQTPKILLNQETLSPSSPQQEEISSPLKSVDHERLEE